MMRLPLKMLRRLRAIALLCAFAAVAPGCVNQAGWVYEPNPAEHAPVELPLTLAVSRFQDQRPAENETHFFLCLIPGVPYCKASYHRPDAANGFYSAGAYNFRPSEDLAEAAAQEIRQTGMFREVYVAEHNLPKDSELVLHGTILNTDWSGTEYTYGLAGDGQALWLLGLPVGTLEDKLQLRLELVETATGKTMWNYEINGDYKKTEGFYYNYGADFGYPQMLREGMKQALASLESYAQSQPPDFWRHMHMPE